MNPPGVPLHPQVMPLYHEGQVNNKLVALAKITPFLIFLGVSLFFGGGATTAWAYNTPDSDFFRNATERERTVGPIVMVLGIVILLITSCICVYMRKKGVHVPLLRRNMGPRYVTGGIVTACPVSDGTTAHPYIHYPPQTNMPPYYNPAMGYSAPHPGIAGAYPPPSGTYPVSSANQSAYPASSSALPPATSAYPATATYPAVSDAYPAASGYPGPSDAYPPTSNPYAVASGYPPSVGLTSDPYKTAYATSDVPSYNPPTGSTASPPFNPHYAPSNAQLSTENSVKPSGNLPHDLPPPYSQDNMNLNAVPPPYSTSSVHPQNPPYSAYYTSPSDMQR